MSLLLWHVATVRASAPTRQAVAADTIEVTRDRLNALEAIAAAALAWEAGLTGADPILTAVSRHRHTLDPDPGARIAWPETDVEPVPGVDYLPIDEDRNWVPPQHGGLHDGGDPTSPGYADAIDQLLAHIGARQVAA